MDDPLLQTLRQRNARRESFGHNAKPKKLRPEKKLK